MTFIRPTFKDLTLAYNKGTPKSEFMLALTDVALLAAEPKYDGRWGILVHEQESSAITLYSRHNQIQRTYENNLFKVYPAFKLHGEYIFGTNFAKNSPLEDRVILFDITECATCCKDMSLQRRRSLIATLLDRFRLDNIDLPFELIQPITAFVDPYDGDSIDALRPYVTDPDQYEGVVIKDYSCPWGADTWYRIKPVFEMDYVIMGFNQSDAPKYRGRMVSSIRAGLYIDGELTEVCNVSGLNEKQRKGFFERPNLYVGKVITASGKSLFKSGALRHPNFVRMHPTKLADECTFRRQ